MYYARCKKDKTPLLRKAMIYMTLFVIGAIFYLATLLVHALVPDMRRSIKGLSLMAHCACMLAAHIAQVVAETEVFTSISESEVVCKILAYFCQYTILGGFFWLNVMCLDIGNTFRSLKSMVQCVNLDYSSELRKFQKYCVYAFGVPLILMLVTFGVDQSDLDYNNPFNPNIGLTACWLDNDSSAIIVFFYGPVGLLVLTNTVLFIYVSCKISSGDPVLKNISSFTKRRHRKSVILYSKLSALMGLHWIIGIILEAVGDENYWYFNNFINAVRSIFIFRMAVYKTKVWKMLKKDSKISSSIRWFSRRVGHKDIIISEDQQEIDSQFNNESDGKFIRMEIQQQSEDDGDSSINQQGITNSAFDAQEMQVPRTNQ